MPVRVIEEARPEIVVVHLDNGMPPAVEEDTQHSNSAEARAMSAWRK